jgi:hypothetical protein
MKRIDCESFKRHKQSLSHSSTRSIQIQKRSKTMRNRLIHCAILLTIALCLSENTTQAQTRSSKDQFGNHPALTVDRVRSFDLLTLARPKQRAGFALMPSRSYTNASGRPFNISPMAAGPTLPVLGSGTVGRLPKWTGITSSNSFIGDSTIFESKLGLVGIGTDTPTSRLTVAGLIESTSGGFKFPDGTVQTTSASGALFSVAHDATLAGDGTVASPLGVAVPLVLSGSLPGTAVVGIVNSSGTGLDAQSSGGVTSAAVRGIHSANGFGVIGSSAIGTGVLGGTEGISAYQDDPAGVVGRGVTKAGVIGLSNLGVGVRGQSNFGRGVVGIGGNNEFQGGTVSMVKVARESVIPRAATGSMGKAAKSLMASAVSAWSAPVGLARMAGAAAA